MCTFVVFFGTKESALAGSFALFQKKGESCYAKFGELF